MLHVTRIYALEKVDNLTWSMTFKYIYILLCYGDDINREF